MLFFRDCSRRVSMMCFVGVVIFVRQIGVYLPAYLMLVFVDLFL